MTAPRKLRKGDRVRDNLTGEVLTVAEVSRDGRQVTCEDCDEIGPFRTYFTRPAVTALPRSKPKQKPQRRKER